MRLFRYLLCPVMLAAVILVACSDDKDEAQDNPLSPGTTSPDFWTDVNTGLDSCVNVYALTSNADGHVLAATEVGVFRSDDNGESWTRLPHLSSVCYSISINSAGDIFAGTDHGVHRRDASGDGNWTGCGLDEQEYGKIAALAVRNASIYAGTEDGVYRSQSNGDPDTWEHCLSYGDAFHRYYSHRTVNALATDSHGGILAAVEGDMFAEDEPVAARRAGLFHDADANCYYGYRSLGYGYPRSLAFNAEGPVFVGTGGYGYYGRVSWSEDIYNDDLKSLDWGLEPEVTGWVYALAIDAGGHIFAGLDKGEGVLRSTDNGATWSRQNSGLTVADVRSLVITSKGYIFAGTIGGGIYRAAASK